MAVNADIVRRSALDGLWEREGTTRQRAGNWRVVQSFGEPEKEFAAVRYGIGLLDVSDWTRIVVEAGRQTAEQVIGLVFGAAEQPILSGRVAGQTGVYRLRDDHFFILGQTGQDGDLVARLEAAAKTTGEPVAITNVTDGQAALLLIGPRCVELLGRLCALDFDERAFPSGQVRQSSVAGTRQVIIRRDVGGLPAYLLSGGRSYAVYLWQTLLEAGVDLGLVPVGRQVISP